METFVIFCGFLGSWLLVAGPVYQAALELQEEELERELIESVRRKLPLRPHASAWWWLLPPVKLILERRLEDRYRKDFMAALPNETMAAMLHFMNKASGWVLVSAGGLLLVMKETYELVGHFEWNPVCFWPIAVSMAGLCVTNTAVRMSRTKQITSVQKPS